MKNSKEHIKNIKSKVVLFVVVAVTVVSVIILESYPDIFPDTIADKYILIKANIGNSSAQNSVARGYYYDTHPDYEKALYWFNKAADADNNDAQCELADIYYEGKNAPIDYKKSFDLYSNAITSCGKYGLVKFYENGIVVEKDINKAISMLEDIKNKQIEPWQEYYDAKYLGEKVEVALERNKIAAGLSNNDPETMFQMGAKHDIDGDDNFDENQAVDWYKKAAALGNNKAIARLGVMFYDGYADNAPDYVSAIPLLKTASDSRDSEAKLRLALAYNYGNGVEVDKKNAFKLFKESSDSGNMDARCNLAKMYITGDGGEQDQNRAFRLLSLCAKDSDSGSKYILGRMYYEGMATAKDAKKAIQFLEFSAAQRNTAARNYLGFIYLEGKEVKVNLIESYMWFNLSAMEGDKDGAIYRESLSKLMTRDDILKAQDMTRSWKAVDIIGKNIGASNPDSQKETVNLVKQFGVYAVPVKVNDTLVINFVVDSGAADVMISSDVASTLLKAGAISQSDYLPDAIYIVADGSQSKVPRLKLRSIKIGSRVITDVTCGIAKDPSAPMLLGQSALQKLGSYRVDYQKEVLVID